MRSLFVAVVAVVAGLIVGCGGGGGGGGGGGTSTPAPTVSVTISATMATLNSTVTVTWSSTNATSCGITELATNNLSTSGSRDIVPTVAGNFTYTVQCTGSGGSASQQVSLTVPKVPTVAVSVSPTTTVLGADVALTWSSTDASSCTASGAWTGGQSLSGTQTVAQSNPGVASYTLTCSGAGGSANATAALAVGFVTSMTTAEIAPLPAPILPNPAHSGPLSMVRSYEYLLGANPGTPGMQDAFARGIDLLIIQEIAGVQLHKAAADPTGSKIVLAYVDLAESQQEREPQFYVNGTVPPWFGNQNPGLPGLYSVQYWNAAWHDAMLDRVDHAIDEGYDGAYLDELNGAYIWGAGNPFGNTVNPNATQDMADLVTAIRAHVRSKYPGKAVYLMGGPFEFTGQFQEASKNLDAEFNEVVYYGQPVGDLHTSQYLGQNTAKLLSATIDPFFRSVGAVVFGNDYPLPLSDSSVVIKSFAFYSHYGWIPSVQHAQQTEDILHSGPFMFMATATNTHATGATGYTNYLSGGVAPIATLTGGDQANFFIGGPGQNTIAGGAGDDTIWAHPDYAALKGKLVFSLSYSFRGPHTDPAVAISVNGQAAVPTTTLTSAFGTSTQVFAVDVSKLASLSSIVITVSNTSFDGTNFSNVAVERVIYNGAAADLSAAAYPNGGYNNGNPFSNAGTVTIPTSAFASPSPPAANTSDTIDGGAGANTVTYRASSDNYTLAKQPNGSWLVTSASTAEGPDTLTNIQQVKFTDKTVTLN